MDKNPLSCKGYFIYYVVFKRALESLNQMEIVSKKSLLSGH